MNYDEDTQPGDSDFKPLDTINKFMITRYNEKVVSMMLKFQVSPKEALEMASMLIVAAIHLGESEYGAEDVEDLVKEDP